ncbi:MAG: G-D-S-L family lipolytic protein [Flavobacterium sp.]
MTKNFKWLLLASITIVACSYDDGIPAPVAPEVPVVAGEADFSKYVALGNSLTAGFSDNALFRAGQANAYSKLLADQFALAGGGAFTYPETNDNVGGLLLGGNVIQGPRLIFNGSAPISLPGGVPTTEITNVLSGPFNNMGVPGAKSYHLLAPNYGNVAGVLTGQANPYFVRFASSPTTSIIADAVAQNPTFFTLWIGNNDVLGYASSGGTGANQLGNPNPATYADNDISDPTMFASVYENLVNALTANGAKGAVATLPYVNSAPFFTVVPHNPVPLDAATAQQLNTQLIGPLKQVLTALGQGDRLQLLVAASNNPLLIKDESLTDFSAQITGALTQAGFPAAQAAFFGQTYGQARHTVRNTTNRDYVLLTTRSIIGSSTAPGPAPLNTYGVTYPLQDQHVLTYDEVAQVKTATDAFNTTIRTIAETKNLAFIDVNVILTQLANGGVRFDNFHMTDAFVRGGTFSLDGIHLTARANAYIANQFAAAINAKYGSTLRMYKPQQFPLSYPASLN